jgi:sulfotransferase
MFIKDLNKSEKVEYNMKKFVCLSGLPRTGSTLLTSILSQNPEIHAEGNSAVSQLMWDMRNSCLINCSERLLACNRLSTIDNLLKQIPKIYYSDVKESIIIDKGRTWTLPGNFELLKKFVDEDIKIIVMERPITDIVKSFIKLEKEHDPLYDDTKCEFLTPGSDPIMLALQGLNWAKKNNDKNNFLFIKYYDLVNNPKETIDNIYNFCGWPHYQHDFENIICKYPENDFAYKIPGLHKIRPKIGFKKNEIDVCEKILEQCEKVDKIMGYI